MTRERASEMLRESITTEVTDILCHRLLRHLPFAMDVAVVLSHRQMKWSATEDSG